VPLVSVKNVDASYGDSPVLHNQLVAEGILRLLDKLQNELNLSYMFITHDLATVGSITDEVVVMQYGVVVEQWPKDVMFKPPHHEYTNLLLPSVPEIDPDWPTTLLEERGVDNIGEAAKNKQGSYFSPHLLTAR
jgi:peptide/nickel transport system ATP-binding protein